MARRRTLLLSRRRQFRGMSTATSTTCSTLCSGIATNTVGGTSFLRLPPPSRLINRRSLRLISAAAAAPFGRGVGGIHHHKRGVCGGVIFNQPLELFRDRYFSSSAGGGEEDYYTILGVDEGTSSDEIKRMYLKKAKECHPDMNPNDPSANAKFQRLSKAYSVLKVVLYFFDKLHRYD